MHVFFNSRSLRQKLLTTVFCVPVTASNCLFCLWTYFPFVLLDKRQNNSNTPPVILSKTYCMAMYRCDIVQNCTGIKIDAHCYITYRKRYVYRIEAFSILETGWVKGQKFDHNRNKIMLADVF